MSFNSSGVVGQGSIRPATTQNREGIKKPPKQQADDSRQVALQSENGRAEMKTQVARQRQIKAADRSREKAAAEQASRENVEREVEQALKELKDVNLSFNHKLKYSIDHKEESIVVKVIDPDTDKVIKELPPVALQRFHSRLQKYLGILVDEEA